MCFISLLREDKIIRGVIIKETYGHKLFTPFNNDQKATDHMKKHLLQMGVEIVEEIVGDKHALRKRILELNKKANLPGIYRAQKAA